MTSHDVDRPPTLLERLGERLNPVLVKEVRQSLRGAYFRRTFFLTLSAIVTLGLIVLTVGVREGNERLGEEFFTVIYGCLCAAVLVLVPIFAFFSVGAEKEENTFDLLVLSNIKPRQIVLGKLHSAGILDLLFLSAALPFLVCGYLLPGADLTAMLYLLAAALFLSTGLSLVAIALSTLTSIKFVRVMLLAAMFFGLTMVMIGMTAFAAELMRRPGDLRDDDFWLGTLWLGLAVGFAGAFAVCVAAANLSHAEENRSTPQRLVMLAACLFTPIGLAATLWKVGYDDEGIMGVTLIVLCLLSGPSVFLVTEPERMPRRAALSVPRSRFLAALAAPLLPGGGRGFLFLLLQIGLLVAFALLVFVGWRAGHPTADLDGVFATAIGAAYIVIYLGLPSLLFSRNPSRKGRVVARVAVFAFPVISILLPALFGLFLDDDSLIDLRHVGNPIFVMDRAFARMSGDLKFGAVCVCVVALLVVIANVPRVVAGLREVAEARRANLARVEAEREVVDA